jgi:hypothetical protein
MFKDFKINHPLKVLLYLSLMFSVIVGCSRNMPTAPRNTKLVPVTFRVSLEQSYKLGSISYLLLTVTAADMDPMQKTIAIHDSTFEDTLVVPAGTVERQFKLEAKSSGGRTLYSGSASAMVEAGKTNTINIEMLPAVLMLKMTPRYQQVNVDNTFNLSVEIYNVDSLFGVSFRIEFDNSRLQYLGASLPSPTGILGEPDAVIFFDTSGTNYVAVSITRMYPDTMVSGNGALAQLRFRAISPGTANLNFTSNTLRLVEKSGQSIPGFDDCVLDEAICDIASISISPYIISPTVTLNDNVNYHVESAYIGMSYSTSTWVYGIIKVTYLGSDSRDYIYVDASFKNSNNYELFTDWSFAWNITTCYTGYYNTNTFFTPTHSTGYYFIIEYLGDYGITLSDISKVDLTLTSSTFTYAPALGTLSKVGNPYRIEPDSWYLDVKNSGDRQIQSPFTRFIFKDSQDRMFKWTFPFSYIGDTLNEVYDIGQSGYFGSWYNTPDYIQVPLDFADVCLEWDPYTESGAPLLPKINQNMSTDEKNKLILEEIDNIERERMMGLNKR